jgi:hypothetical protein
MGFGNSYSVYSFFIVFLHGVFLSYITGFFCYSCTIIIFTVFLFICCIFVLFKRTIFYKNICTYVYEYNVNKKRLSRFYFRRSIGFIANFGLLYFIILLFVNSVCLLLNRLFYIFYIFFWSYRLYKYYNNNNISFFDCKVIEFETESTYFFYFYCVIVIKAKLGAFNTIYFFIYKRFNTLKLPYLLILYNFLVNILLRIVVGYSKQVIYDSFILATRLSNMCFLERKNILYKFTCDIIYPLF